MVCRLCNARRQTQRNDAGLVPLPYSQDTMLHAIVDHKTPLNEPVTNKRHASPHNL